MEVKIFAALLIIAMIVIGTAVWMHDYRLYKKDRPIYIPPEEQQFVICAMERCKHCHNGNCLLKYISHDENGKCVNFEVKQLDFRV